jgi:hypothetical protein
MNLGINSEEKNLAAITGIILYIEVTGMVLIKFCQLPDRRYCGMRNNDEESLRGLLTQHTSQWPNSATFIGIWIRRDHFRAQFHPHPSAALQRVYAVYSRGTRAKNIRLMGSRGESLIVEGFRVRLRRVKGRVGREDGMEE